MNDSSSTKATLVHVSDAKFVHASCTEVIFLSTVATHFAPSTYLQVSARSCSARPTTAAYVDLLLLRRLRLLLRRRRRRRRAIRGSAVRLHPPRFGSDNARSDAKVADNSRHRRIAQQHLRWVHNKAKKEERSVSQSPAAAQPWMVASANESTTGWRASPFPMHKPWSTLPPPDGE